MSFSIARPLTPLASQVWFDHDMLRVRLVDGREIAAPLELFPELRRASDRQKSNWRIIGKGEGIHWDDLDEDLSVLGLLES